MPFAVPLRGGSGDELILYAFVATSKEPLITDKESMQWLDKACNPPIRRASTKWVEHTIAKSFSRDSRVLAETLLWGCAGVVLLG